MIVFLPSRQVCGIEQSSEISYVDELTGLPCTWVSHALHMGITCTPCVYYLHCTCMLVGLSSHLGSVMWINKMGLLCTWVSHALHMGITCTLYGYHMRTICVLHALHMQVCGIEQSPEISYVEEQTGIPGMQLYKLACSIAPE